MVVALALASMQMLSTIKVHVKNNAVQTKRMLNTIQSRRTNSM